MDPENTALADFVDVADRVGLPYVLVGAGGLHLSLVGPHGLDGFRSTYDWDIGVLAEDWDAFDRLRAELTKPGVPFARTRIPHRFEHESATPIDIVPFGDIESASGSIEWPNEDVTMDVTGFKQVYDDAGTIEASGLVLRVASLPGIALLKTRAYLDRRTHATVHDLEDLLGLMRHYDETGDDVEPWVTFAQALNDEELEAFALPAAQLGRDVASRFEIDWLEPLLSETVDPSQTLLRDLRRISVVSMSDEVARLRAFTFGARNAQALP